MTRSIQAIAFASVLFGLSGAISVADACPRDGRKIVYYSHGTTVPSVRTVQVNVEPVIRSAVVSTVHQVKKTVVAAPKPVERPKMEVGSTVRAAVSFLGADEGHVLLHIGPVTHPCEILEWKTNSVVFKVPEMGLRSATPAELEVVRPDGRIARSFLMQIVPEPTIVIFSKPNPGFDIPSQAGAEVAEGADVQGTILQTSTSETVTVTESN